VLTFSGCGSGGRGDIVLLTGQNADAVYSNSLAIYRLAELEAQPKSAGTLPGVAQGK